MTCDNNTDQMGDNNASVAVCNYSDVLCFGTLYNQVTPDVWRMSLGTLIVLYTVLQHSSLATPEMHYVLANPVHTKDIP